MKRIVTLCVMCVVSLVVQTTCRALPLRYTITDLGTLGGEWGGAYDINNASQVVGYATTPTGSNHAFLWDSATGMKDLGTLGGKDYSIASGINDRGQVVGTSFASNDQDSDTSVIWEDGTGMRALSTGPHSAALRINDAGEAVGIAENAAGNAYAFIWDATNGTRSLGNLGGDFGVARDINNAGQVVGQSVVSGWSYSSAFIWSTATGMQSLGISAGLTSQGFAINDVGQVAGSYDVAGGSTAYRAFIWDATNGMMALGLLGDSSEAHDINESGQVVGYVRYLDATAPAGCIDHVFLWENGVMTDLNNAALSEPGWELISAGAINDSGQIVGGGKHNGIGRAFLLTPVPEPSSLIGLLSGIGGLGITKWWRRKQARGRP